MQYRHRTALSFYLGTAAATILAAGAWAQGGQAIESVVVTGSHIAGVAPVGSPVVTVDQKTMDDRGFPTLSAMLSDLPQVDQIGPSPTGLTGGNNVEHAGGNQTYATSINLRGIDPADTLNLIDGMRLVAESSNSIHDVNVVPSMMVQRIDVVADGGSAIYGSDAITGTINVILKKPVGGVNLMASGSNDPGQWGYQGGISIGSTWETPVLGNGGLLVALEYRHSDPLIEAHRPHVYFQNLSPYMGAAAPTPSTSASPGTVTLTPTGNISQCGPSPIVPAPVTAPTNCLYAIPTGVGIGQGISLSQLGPANHPNFVDDNAFRNAAYATPRNDRWNAGITFKQALTSWLDFYAAAYGQTSISLAQSGSNAVTLVVPNTNPYSPCATAGAAALVGRTAPSQTNSQNLVCPATAPGQGITIGLSLLPYLGANAGTGSRHGDDRQYSMRAGFNFSLPFDWSGSIAELYAGDWSRGHDPNIDTTALNQVLGWFVTSTSNINSTATPTASQLTSYSNGTNPATFTVYTKPQNIPFFNPFCDASKYGAACADPLTLSYIQAATEQIATNNIAETQLNLNGPIFDLPAGTVKLAVGAEYDNETFLNHRNTTNSAALGGTKVYTIDGVSRNYASFFEELYIPVIGGNFTLPGIQELDIDIAHRYTAYNIAGVTSNPKIGVNYTPFDGLKLRGNYGTSFRAPAISDTDVVSGTSLGGGGLQSGFVGLQNPNNVPTANGIQATGGFPGLKPQTAVTWNVGLNYAPSWLSGLDLDFSYFNISMRKVIGSPERNAGNPGLVNQGIFDDEIAFNPTFWGSRAKASSFVQSLVPGLTHGATLTQAQYDLFITNFFGPGSKWHNLTPPNTPVLYICDCETHNAGNLRMDGLDMVGDYITDIDWGTASFGYSASYTFDLDQGLVPGAPMTPTLNAYTFPLRFQGRLHAGLQHDAWSAQLGLNFKNGYRADPTTLVTNAPAKYYHVHSWTTFDASFSYNFAGDAGVMMHDTSLALAISNILNQGPPLLLQGGEVNYDAANASAAGRIITLTIRKTL